MSGTERPSRVGAQFGPYRLIRLIGRGGMGEVYEAEDTAKDRIVALKLLPPTLSDNQEFRERLRREAQIAGRLHEPHVVPIHGCDEIEGQLYVDMRLVDGTDLRKILDRNGPLTPARAVAIVRQIAAALDAAHGAGTMHRDVKPENILIGDDDFACLLDFGIANAATEEKLTKQGVAVGTFAYMAPERFTDAEVTYRVDIYSLACVLFECLTGSAPYQGSGANLMNAHLTRPVPHASTRRPGIPVGFDQVIADGMAKEPEDRHTSAGELARAASNALAAPDQYQVADIPHPSQALTLRGDSGLTAQSAQAERTAPAQLDHHWPEAVAVGRPISSPSAPTALSPSGLLPNGPAQPEQAMGPHQWSPQPSMPWPTHLPSKRNPWIFLAAAALIIVAILGGLGIWLGNRPQPPQPRPSQPVTPPTTLTAPGGNASSDTEFLAALNKDNIVIADAAKTISNGHLTCTKLSNGVPFGTMVQQLTNAYPDLSASQAQYFVFESVEIYCPENRNLVEH
jgi:serine/threonine protein kinase